MAVNLEYYKIFYFTAKAGSISNASKELFISQPAVSQSIKHLEEKLGGQLFFRTPKGIVLTAEGEVLYKYIEQAYNFIITAENKFIEMQELIRGEIKIGASDTLCKYYLLPYLEDFNNKYPKIRIHVTNRTSIETINLLKSGKVDLGVINLPVEEDNQLMVRETITVQDCFVVGEKNKQLSNNEISIVDLNKYPLMLLEKEARTRNYIDSIAKEHNVKLVPEIELGSIDLLVQFAKIGLGISCVIKDFVKEELKSKKLYEIKLKEQIPKRKIGIVTLKEVPLSAASKKFIELLGI